MKTIHDMPHSVSKKIFNVLIAAIRLASEPRSETELHDLFAYLNAQLETLFLYLPTPKNQSAFVIGVGIILGNEELAKVPFMQTLMRATLNAEGEFSHDLYTLKAAYTYDKSPEAVTYDERETIKREFFGSQYEPAAV